MKTKTSIAKTTSPHKPAGHLSGACAARLLLLLLLALPAMVQAQFTFILTNGAITITGYTGTNGSVVIPATMDGYPVTSMGERAFQWCTSVTNVTIPDGVTNFGDFAFSDIDGDNVFSLCTSLTAINVDAGNPVCSSLAGVLFNQGQTTLLECPEAEAGSYLVPGSVTFIAANAFFHCPNLASVTIPASVICLGNYAFAACGALTNVTLGPNVACIGDQAFAGTSLTSVTLDDNVTNLGSGTFMQCANLTSITIPNSVTTIGGGSFWACPSLTSITIPDGVTRIGSWMFTDCHSLTNIVIGNGVTNIGDMAFVGCHSLATMFFTGNAPANPGDNFNANTNLTVYAVLGTTGWGSTFEGMPVRMLPGILWPPQSQTAELGATVDFTPEVPGTPTVTCLWFFNSTNFIYSGTNACLELTNVGYSMDGAYTLVVTNVNGAVTSSPAMFNVIPAVAHRPIPVVQLSGATGSMLNVDYANVLTPTLNWTMLGSVSLTSPSQFYFDTSMPLAPQRFYRVWQPGSPGVVPSVSVPGLIPMVTLTGTVGNHLELDYINQFGPTNAWATLGTITLTNTAQPYFDVSALRQPARLYRITTVP